MQLAREDVIDAAIGVEESDASEGLSAIRKPGCAAAIWRRQLPSGLQTWIDTLEPEDLPRARLVLRPDAVEDTIAQLCKARRLQDDAECGRFVADIAALSTMFATIMDAPYLRLRLDVVTTNACRKFHIDAVTARLVCAYRGAGTQYGTSTEGAEPTRIFSVPTGAPIVLRGTLWPNDPPSGLRHRSPPIEGTGETRLLLVLDPVQNLDEDGD